jgi:hypothetical protein
MQLNLDDEQTAALLRELDRIIENDKFPLSPRIQTLKAIRTLIQPDPVRAPAAPPQPPLEPPSKGRYRRRR